MAARKDGASWRPVTGVRRQGRECALQFLYQSEFHLVDNDLPGGIEKAFALFSDHFRKGPKVRDYGRQLVLGVWEKREDIVALLRKYAKNWRLERMSRIDRNILKIALYELCFKEDIPPRVAINEALEIAKQYGDDESPAFINGILDSVRRATHHDD